MNKLFSSVNIFNRFTSSSKVQEASTSLDLYFQKLSHANTYRYRNRMYLKPIAYPPNLRGEEEYELTAKKSNNTLIKRLLRVKLHPERMVFPNEYSLDGPPKGRIYDKYPFKYTVEKGKTYSFCTCGFSNSQPFCDGMHKTLWGTALKKTTPKYRPIKYIADETKDVWFCNCKQSNSRPFCDGTHKLDVVQKENSVK